MTQEYLIFNVSVATMRSGDDPYGIIRDGGIAVRDGLIAWVGAMRECPAEYREFDRHDYAGRLATPALIDCHTHLVHGGNRAREFEMRWISEVRPQRGTNLEVTAAAGLYAILVARDRAIRAGVKELTSPKPDGD